MNDGSLWRPRVSDGRLVFAGQSKPVRPAAGAEIRVAPPAGLRVLDEIDPWPGPKAAAAPPRPPPPPKAEPPDELW
jgi:hypothetical protein